MTEHRSQHRNDRLGRAILFTVGTLMGAAWVLLWSWNTLAVDLFNMATAQFKHALALEFVLLAAFLIHHASRKLLAFNHSHRARRSPHGIA